MSDVFTYDPKDIVTVQGQQSIIEALIEDFNSSQLAQGDYGTLPIVAFGRVNVIGTLFSNTSGIGFVQHNLGYPPAFQVYLDLFGDGSAYIHLPYATFDITNNYHTVIYHQCSYRFSESPAYRHSYHVISDKPQR